MPSMSIDITLAVLFLTLVFVVRSAHRDSYRNWYPWPSHTSTRSTFGIPSHTFTAIKAIDAEAITILRFTTPVPEDRVWDKFPTKGRVFERFASYDMDESQLSTSLGDIDRQREQPEQPNASIDASTTKPVYRELNHDAFKVAGKSPTRVDAKSSTPADLAHASGPARSSRRTNDRTHVHAAHRSRTAEGRSAAPTDEEAAPTDSKHASGRARASRHTKDRTHVHAAYRSRTVEGRSAAPTDEEAALKLTDSAHASDPARASRRTGDHAQNAAVRRRPLAREPALLIHEP